MKKKPSSFSISPLFASKKDTMMCTSTARWQFVAQMTLDHDATEDAARTGGEGDQLRRTWVLICMLDLWSSISWQATRMVGFVFHDMLTLTRWSGDVMKRPGHKHFNAVSHNRSRPEVLFFNLTWWLRGQISSVLLQLLLFAFSNRKFGRHGKWSVTFWQWENNT